MATINNYQPLGSQVWGKQNTQAIVLQPTPGDYVAGGYILTPGQNGIATTAIYGVKLIAGGAGYGIQFSPTTRAVQMYSAPGAEVATGTDLSGTSFTLLLIGA